MNLTKNNPSAVKMLGLASLCMFPLTILLSVPLSLGLCFSEWMAGWSVALVNAVLAVAIYAHALTKSGNAFLIWAIGVNSVRAVCMIGVVVAICMLAIERPLPYLIAVLSGILCLMVAEVWYLFRRLS